MDEFNPYRAHILFTTPESDYKYQERLLVLAARRLFDRAYLRSRIEQIWRRLTRRPAFLLDLDDLSNDLGERSCHYAGVKCVPVERIRGSEGRRLDFTEGFLPLRDHLRSRWECMAFLILKGEALPPVELIQIGDIFFVRDGHHRVSVSRALGRDYIDAEITVWEVKGSPAWETGFAQGYPSLSPMRAY